MEKVKMQWEKNGYILRSFEEGQAEKYYRDCMSRPDPEVNRLTGSSGTFSRKEIVDYYDRVVNDPNRYDFVLCSPEGSFIGESVINEIDWDLRSANFRIAIFDSRNCSKGTDTWATELTRDFAFENLKLHRLELDVFSFNSRAKRVYEKAGFKVEGVRRDAILDGKNYADDIIMSILEDEWRQLKAR